MLTRVLPAIVAAGVILGGVVLWRLCSLRRELRPLRWIVAVLTAYGAATLIYCSFTGITLYSSIRGAAIPAIPYVLQGSFIGALIILPLGWLASVLRAGFPRFRIGSAAPAALQAIALTACIGILFTSFPKGESGNSATQTKEDRLRALDKSLSKIEESERNSPRDHWDLDYVVNTVGRDPQRLFSWVRDNTFWIPYRGVLRGPVGVLMDRQGNGLDRALLLAALLEKAGQRARLAQGELTQQQAVQLLPNLVARRRAYAGETSSSLETASFKSDQKDSATEEDVSTVTSHFQPVAAMLGTDFSIPQEKAVRSPDEVIARVSKQAAVLMSRVDGPDSRQEWEDRLQAAMGALRDHWWVQVLKGGQWLDLDVLSDSQTSLAPIRETV